MLSGVGTTDGVLERLLMAGGAPDISIVAGIAVVVGIMLWTAGARAVSLAFAAAGGTAGLFAGITLSHHVTLPDVGGLPGSIVAGAAGAAAGVVIALLAMRLVVATAAGATAAAAAAGLAVLFGPHLPLGTSPTTQTPPPASAPSSASFQPVSWTEPATAMAALAEHAQAVEPLPTREIAGLTTNALNEHATEAWQRVPEPVRGEAALIILACGLCGAVLGAIWPSRTASATTAFMGAAIWPLGALQMQSLAGTPIAIDDVPIQTWLAAWLVLGVIGLVIQRLVVRKLAQS